MLKKAIILGAGPAGLAVARELLQRADIQPILLEPANEPDDVPAASENPFPDPLTSPRFPLRQGFGWLRRIRIYLSRLWAWLFSRPERSLEDTDDITQRIEERGGGILYHQCIYAIYAVPNAICSVHVIDSLTGELSLHTADYFYSTIPIRDLIRVVQADIPEEVRDIADHLLYRDVIKVDVELSQIAMPQPEMMGGGVIVSRVGFGDYDGYRGSARVVMEYCCMRGDDFWRQGNAAIRRLAMDELEKMGVATSNDVIAMRVRRLDQAVPVNAGSYARLHTIKSFTGSFQNLFLVDRNDISGT